MSPYLKAITLDYLTNNEALTALCSVVKHVGFGWSTRELSGETRDVVECFSLFLECFSRFLHVLQHNRAQSRLLYLFLLNFQRNSLTNFQKKLLADGVTALAPGFILS